MTVEEQILNRVRALPPERQAEVLDFAEFLQQKAVAAETPVSTQRPLGLLRYKASCRIDDDFLITDEELLAQ